MKKTIYFLGYIIGFIIIAYISYTYVKMGISHTNDIFLKKGYFVLATAVFVIVLASLIYLKLTKFSIVKIYPIVLTLFGLAYMYVFPAMSAPDEIAHFISAYKISNIMLGERATVTDGHVIIRAGDLWMEDTDNEYKFDANKSVKEGVLIPEGGSHGKIVSSKLEEASYKVFYGEGNIRSRNSGISFKGKTYDKAQSLHSPVNTIPSVYFFAALGISIARILGLGSVYLVIFGRLANLAVFVLLTSFAIKLLPKFKEFIFLIGLFPTTIELAASYSYDAIMIASLIFFVSYVFYLAYEKYSFNIKDLIVVTLFSGLILPCKMVYFPILLILFLVPMQKFSVRGKVNGKIKKENITFFLASAVTVLLSFVIAMYLVNRATVVGYSTSNTDSLEWAGEQSYTIGYLIHNKAKAIKLFYNTIILQLEYYHGTMMGTYLGHADTVVGIPYIGFLVLNTALILSVFGEGKEKLLLLKDKILVTVSVGFMIFLILLSMLIAWTPISSQFIEGVSGRYFIPVMLPILLVLQNNKLSVKNEMKRTLIFLFIFVNGLSLLQIFATVCIRL